MSTPTRIQRQRTKGWRMPDNTVYVGRPTRWGNPFRAGVEFCGPTIRCLYSPTELVDQFRAWLAMDTLHPLFWDKELIAAHTAMKVALLGRVLAGKTLACWCPIERPCHADVLLEVANSPAGEHLIWSHHHKAWWGPNGSGYRSQINDAGQYTLPDTKQWLGRGCACCEVPEVPVPAGQVFQVGVVVDLDEVIADATTAVIKAGDTNRHYAGSEVTA